ncbi:MAG: hypothetical protein RLZZ543_992 [Bacteroidota bacterium]|jgi:hypothetical protein
MQKRITLLLLACALFTWELSNAQIVINEGSNRNYSSIADEDGDYPDWIELHNAGADSVNLFNYALSDALDQPSQWLFPSITLAPGEFKVIFCSGKDRKPVSSFQHVVTSTSFNPVTGWNTHAFDEPFYWDGISNVLINVCSYSSTGYTVNSIFNQSETSYNSTLYSFQDNSPASCTAQYGTAATRRPNMMLNGSIIGTGVSQNGNTDYPAPYGNWYWGARHQMLIPASELLASGLSAGYINSLGFDVAWTEPSTVYDYIEINMKLVSEASLNTTFQAINLNNNQHTNFKIARDGETIYLFSPDHLPISSLNVSVQNLNNTNGLFPDASANQVLFETATAAASNNAQVPYSDYALAPILSSPSGLYQTTLNVNISDTNPAAELAEIRYTTDGSEPNSSSTLYSGNGVFIFASTTIRARAFVAGKLPSNVSSASYLLGLNHVTPIISVMTDNSNLYGDAGIFDHWDMDWQRPTHVDYFDTDHSLIFSQNSGMQIDGGWGGSRSYPQHSFRLELDNGVLGDGTVNFPFIPNRPNRTKYSNFYLRNGSNQFLALPYKDASQVMMMAGETNNYFSAMRPVTVYINGNYFGLYELREKFDTEYFKTLENASPSQTEILSASAWYGWGLRAVEGSVDNFYATHALFNQLDPADANFWDNADQYFDMTYYTDYIIGESWMGNTDWPANNIKIYRSDATNQRYRFCTIDLEMSMGGGSTFTDCTVDHIAFMLGQDVNNPYINIFLKGIQNPRFHDYFINRFADNMNTTYRIDRLLGVENDFFNAMVLEMPKEYGRWGDPNAISQQMNTFYNNHLYFQDQLSQRTEIVRNNIQSNFALPNQVDMTLDVFPAGAGKIKISTVTPDEYPWNGVYFNGVPVKIEAIANTGYHFLHWGNNALLNDTLNSVFLDTLDLNSVEFKAYFEENFDVSTQDVAAKNGWSVYPNPAHDQLYVAHPSASKATRYEIIDLAGRIQQSGNIASEVSTSVIDLSALAPSAYVIRLFNAEKSEGQVRFIKTR